MTRADLEKTPQQVAVDVRRGGGALRPHQRRAVARPGPAVAQGRRATRSGPARASGCSTWPPVRARRARPSPSAAPGGGVRLLARHAAGRPRAPARTCRSWPATRCGCRSPTRASTRSSISFGLRNVNDVDLALAELRRVTKPGGRLVVCEFSHPTWSPFRTVYVEYLMRALPAVARAVSSNPDAYVYLAESIRAWPDQAALADGCRRPAGPRSAGATCPAASSRCTGAPPEPLNPAAGWTRNGTGPPSVRPVLPRG